MPYQFAITLHQCVFECSLIVCCNHVRCLLAPFTADVGTKGSQQVNSNIVLRENVSRQATCPFLNCLQVCASSIISSP